ncbi:MAG: hypothetical protein ACOZIN_09350 [Myxococcota bacterium]
METDVLAERVYERGELTLCLKEDEQGVHLEWVGRSMELAPSSFLLPVLTQAVARARQLHKPLVIDFQKLQFFNSSTIGPVVQVLEQARRGAQQVTVLYKKDHKRQALSFTALELFRTADRRVDVRGL